MTIYHTATQEDFHAWYAEMFPDKPKNGIVYDEYWDEYKENTCVTEWREIVTRYDINDVKERFPNAEIIQYKAKELKSISEDIEVAIEETQKKIIEYLIRTTKKPKKSLVMDYKKNQTGENDMKETTTEEDYTNPSYYKFNNFESFEIAVEIAEECEMSPREAILFFNVFKYITRYKRKNGIKDLKKARWYFKKLIKLVEETEGDK